MEDWVISCGFWLLDGWLMLLNVFSSWIFSLACLFLGLCVLCVFGVLGSELGISWARFFFFSLLFGFCGEFVRIQLRE